MDFEYQIICPLASTVLAVQTWAKLLARMSQECFSEAKKNTADVGRIQAQIMVADPTQLPLSATGTKSNVPAVHVCPRSRTSDLLGSSGPALAVPSVKRSSLYSGSTKSWHGCNPFY